MPSESASKKSPRNQGDHTLLPQAEDALESPRLQAAEIDIEQQTDDDDEIATSGFAKLPNLRQVALQLSLYVNLFITVVKLVAYIQTMSLSVLAALLDSVLDVVSQLVLNYTERHSSMQRSSAVYPAGAR
jgi:Co/Zn/Cd efflux system component